MNPVSFHSHCENLDILPAGVIIIQPDYLVTCWNRTVAEWTGIPRQKAISRDLRDFFSHLRERRYALRIQQVFEGGPAVFFSTQFHPHFIPASLPGGGLRFQRTTVHPLVEGDRTYAFIFIDDVTELVQQVHSYREMRNRALREIEERQKKEAALEESEAKFREIFDSVNDAIHIHEIGGDGLPGRFIEVNAVASRMLGYERSEFLCRTPLDLVCGEHSRPMEGIGRDILEKGEAIFETWHRKKDGGAVPVEVHAHRVKIQNRNVVVSIVRDITQRKRDQAVLLALSRELQTIFDNAPAMVWYKDTRNRFIRVNPAAAAAIGLRRDEIEGKSAYDLFPDMADTYYRDDLEVIETKKPKLGIIEQMPVKGRGIRWVETNKVPLCDPGGNVTGILLFASDITERKTAEDALALANQKLSLLSSITRHDILNQVTALRILADLIEMEKDPAAIADFAGKLKVLAGIIEEQVDFTRDYQEIGVREATWQNIPETIRKVADSLSHPGVRIVNEPGMVEILADPLFERVIYNLLDNAFRHGGPSLSEIRVSRRMEGDDLIIVIEDNGAGIPLPDKENIFKRGFGKHSGLGLFLSREILAITGLGIRETGEPGRGARFEILVPPGKFRLYSHRENGRNDPAG